jgi:hypothetical protein
MSSYPIKESSVYLRQVAETYGRDINKGEFRGRDVFCEWPKLELESRGEGKRPLNMERIERSLSMINTRVDCADFVLPAFLSILYLYNDSELLSESDRERFKQAALNYKYAMTDPTEDENGVCYFTENHQALFASCEYIAGQLYPDEIFTNTKQKGAWHRDRGAQRLIQWIEWRACFGFSEWLSSNYYGEDLLALAIVYGLGKDGELKKKAGMLIELLLFDTALNSFNGVLGATNGRTYVQPTLRPEINSVSAVSKLYWGEGSYEAVSLGAVALAVFEYQCSAAVKNAALDKGTFINRERMSLNVEDAKKYGLDPADYDNIMFFWGQQTFLHRDVIANSRKVCPLWLGMRPSIDAHSEKYELCEKEGKDTDPDLACCALTQTDIYTYKTAYYSLSNSQDFRKAKAGYQQHIWQACLGDRAAVFTTNPNTDEYRDRPNRFAGNRFMPRAVQHKNVVLSIYRTPTMEYHFYFTSLYFPQREFDQLREGDGWIFGKRGGAYIAVRCSKAGKWQKPDKELYQHLFPVDYEEEFQFAKPWEYKVGGHAVIWVCEMGDEKTDGSFDQFIAKFKGASITGDTFSCAYNSPSIGKMSFGWNEALKINGEETAIHNYKRYDNPYCRTEFGEKNYLIRCGGEEVKLEF